jgi:hypothetical protein
MDKGARQNETRDEVSATFAKQHDMNRFQDDGGVDEKGKVTDVIEVVFKFAQRVV